MGGTLTAQMGLFTRTERRPVVGSYTSMTAVRGAAEIIDLTAERGKAEARKQEAWQGEAWALYGKIGEVRQAARIFGDSFARCRWFVGVRPSPEDDPVPVDEDNAAELGVSLADADLAAEALARLRSPRGGQSEIRRSLGIQLFVPGEGYLVGRPDPTVPDNERWDIYSTAEFESDPANGVYWLKTGPGAGAAVELPADSTSVTRIYRPHPQWSSWSDSPMRSSLTILEEYADLTDSIRASARSRAYGPGVWVLPNSMRRGVAGGETAGQGDGQAVGNDQVVTDLVTATGLAISDLSSPFARVPVMVWVDDDLWKDKDWSSTLVTWDREVDRVAADQRAELIKRFAVAIDLPAEILTGVADMNHWSAWSVPESAFRDHLAPALVLGCDGITVGYLRPALAAMGVDPAPWEVWFDPSPLLTNVNQAQDYKDAYDRYEASGESLRRVLSIPEDDKPEPDEVARRLLIEQGKKGSVAGKPAPEGDEAEVEDEEGPPPAERPEAEAPVRGAGRDPLDELPRTLARMDEGLLTGLHQRADDAMRRTLERANGRLRALAKRDAAALAAVKPLTAASLMVAPTLGPSLVLALAGDTDLLAGAWDGLASLFTDRTNRAAREAITLARNLGELSDLDAAAMLARLEEDTDRAAGLLITAMAALAGTLLIDPTPGVGPGETDGLLVPSSIMRGALVEAGGGGATATSMLTGLDILALFRRSGIELRGRVWEYGDAAARLTVFEPHHQLNGAEFDDFDELPGSGGAWPFVDHYRPQDHVGCLCQAPYRKAARLPSPEEAAA